LVPLLGSALIFWTVYRLQQDSVHRVRELEQSRAHVVDDSAARLRRIERDLHDGAQAQMVAVTMKLGLAVKKLGGMTDGTGQPTWTGSWSWSLPPTAAPRRPSPSCVTWPAASTPQCSTRAWAPR
jgi:Histidine kinase